jgi:hypothetical protein
MTEALAPSVPKTRLAQLRGRWVSAYLAIWCLLAVAGAGLLGASLFQPISHPAILALRLLKGAVVISVCGILLRRRRDDPVAALLSLAFLTWTITSSFDFASTNVLPMLLDRVRFLLFVLALLLFPDGNWRPGWTRGVAGLSVGVCLLGIAEGAQVFPTRLFLPLAIACVIAAVAALLSRFRTAETEAERQQLKWVALGLVAGVGLILFARAGAALAAVSPTLPVVPILWEAMFQVGIAIVALGFLVSLLRYRLFDAEAAISRSAAFAGLTVVLVATFAGTEACIEWVGQQYLGMGIGNVSAAMAAAVAAVLLSPFHSRISNWAEQRFQRDLVLLKRDLPKILEDLAAVATPQQVGAVALSSINQAVHATRSALIAPGSVSITANGVSLKDVRRNWREMTREAGVRKNRDPGDCLFPVRVELASPMSGKSGWLLLGPRPDGTLYGKEDLDAIKSVRPAIRHALAWAMAREAVSIEQRRQWQSLRREVAELRSRLVAQNAE